MDNLLCLTFQTQAEFVGFLGFILYHSILELYPVLVFVANARTFASDLGIVSKYPHFKIVVIFIFSRYNCN